MNKITDVVNHIKYNFINNICFFKCMFTLFLCSPQLVDPYTEMALKQSGMFADIYVKGFQLHICSLRHLQST